jgi:acetyl-CoA/propionyl-CoA carboxylase biotin carboxyl carrier protein
MAITPEYDSMIGKLIVRGRTRIEALERLRRAIDEYVVVGVPTTLSMLRALCDFDPVVDFTYGTATLEPFAASLAASAVNGVSPGASAPTPSAAPDDTIRVEVDDRMFRVRFVDLPMAAGARPAAAPKPAKGRGRASAATPASGDDVVAPMHGVVVELAVAPGAQIASGDVVAVIEAMKMMNEIRAHRGGTVAQVHAAPGETVEAHARLLTLEPA